MGVGLYETVFEGSLYGGINTLNAHRFSKFEKDFKPKSDGKSEQTANIQNKNSPKNTMKKKKNWYQNIQNSKP